jgi:hypothetical protein
MRGFFILGVPRLWRVGLSAASPRPSCLRAAGFPLQSLTHSNIELSNLKLYTNSAAFFPTKLPIATPIPPILTAHTILLL